MQPGELTSVELFVNGRPYELEVGRRDTLLHVLRDVLGLTGTKCGCGTNDCGACRVIIDGVAKNSCCVPARTLAGKHVETIEGLSNGLVLHPIQQAFIDAGAVQCGFCTPGMIMSAKALLDVNPSPTEAEVREAIRPNLCRCTGYVKIVEAVLLAAERMRRADTGVSGETAGADAAAGVTGAVEHAGSAPADEGVGHGEP